MGHVEKRKEKKTTHPVSSETEMGHVLILLLSKHCPALNSEQSLNVIERLCPKSTLFFFPSQ